MLFCLQKSDTFNPDLAAASMIAAHSSRDLCFDMWHLHEFLFSSLSHGWEKTQDTHYLHCTLNTKTVGPSRVRFRELKNSELWTRYGRDRYTTQHGRKTGERTWKSAETAVKQWVFGRFPVSAASSSGTLVDVKTRVMTELPASSNFTVFRMFFAFI